MARSSALYNQITHRQLFKYSQPGPAFYYPGQAFLTQVMIYNQGQEMNQYCNYSDSQFSNYLNWYHFPHQERTPCSTRFSQISKNLTFFLEDNAQVKIRNPTLTLSNKLILPKSQTPAPNLSTMQQHYSHTNFLESSKGFPPSGAQHTNQ